MEIAFIIVAFIILFYHISSCNKKTFNAIKRLEEEIQYLQKKLIKPEAETEKRKKTVDILSEQEKTSDWTQYQPLVRPQEESAIVPPPPPLKPEPPVIKPIEEEIKPVAAMPDEESKPVITETVETKPLIEPKKKDFEKFVGENLLSKIGIATLVLGIGYFVKYAIDQNWINEIGRVALGILCGGIIIAIAHKLKNKYRTFSSILVGGGIAILYITITIAFRDYRIFSQTVAFILLILITIFSVFLSLLYNRKELAIFSLLGGFASPLMISSGTGNYIVLFSYLLILNSGMLVLAFKKQWQIVSWIAYVLTQLFYWTWLLNSFTKENVGAACFLFLFYAQFYLLALIDHYQSNKNIKVFHALIILTNNLLLFAGMTYIFQSYQPDLIGIITLCIAALNAFPMIILFKDKTIDKRLIYLLIAIVMSFVSLAVPMQLKGCAITMFWAVETVLLLWLWQKSAIKVFKTGFIIVELLVLISLLTDWVNYYFLNVETLLPVANQPFITGLVITASMWFNAWLFKREKSNEFLLGIKNLNLVFSFVAMVLLFFTLFGELQYQVSHFYKNLYFRLLVYGLYFYLFTGVLTAVSWNKTIWKKMLYGGVFIFTLSYMVYNHIVFLVRGEVLFNYLNNWGYFTLHYPALLSIALFFVFLLKNKKDILKNQTQNLIYWFVALTTVIILSTESDNILLMLFYNGENQKSLLKLSHNIIYPILWGITSFVFMITGMKQKSRTLRIISLSLFVLIISKLYLYDIWNMGQTGRIIALVFLGIMFLLVSFLYQKLKVLLKKEETEQEDEGAS